MSKPINSNKGGGGAGGYLPRKEILGIPVTNPPNKPTPPYKAKMKHNHKWELVKYIEGGDGYVEVVNPAGGGQDGRRWVDRPYPPKGIYICICGKRKVVEYKDD